MFHTTKLLLIPILLIGLVVISLTNACSCSSGDDDDYEDYDYGVQSPCTTLCQAIYTCSPSRFQESWDDAYECEYECDDINPTEIECNLDCAEQYGQVSSEDNSCDGFKGCVLGCF